MSHRRAHRARSPATAGYTSVVLSGTVTVTATQTSITFSVAQTLPSGARLVFGAQPGVAYYLSGAVVASTAGTLSFAYTGSTDSTHNTTYQIPASGP